MVPAPTTQLSRNAPAGGNELATGGGVCVGPQRENRLALNDGTVQLLRFRSDWLEDQFLHSPVQQFADIKFIFRRTRDFVNPSELLKLPSCLPEHAEYFPVQGELVDSPGKGIRRV